ncbi:unnamed protein product, partial [Musa banksii]
RAPTSSKVFHPDPCSQHLRGWKEFVADHAMQIGHLLVFRLDGCSSFSVLVFDATACKKEVAFL